QLEHDAARLDDRHPALGGTLARAHPRLCGLLRDRLVREQVDPDLAAPADLPRGRDASGLDLPVRDPPCLEGLEPVVAELHGCLALRDTGAADTVVTAVLCSARP